MKRIHYTDSYLMNPQHPVTVNIIGAGGTSSQVCRRKSGNWLPRCMKLSAR